MSQVSLSQQLKEGNLFAEQCPSREVLKHVTSRWGVLILVALREGTHRFSDLRRKIGGVSEKMLAQSLQALEQDGFLNRIAYPVVPPHVEYSLTPLGEQVSEKVAALADWIELNLPKMSLEGVARVLAGAKFVVSVDTGLSHLTAALDRPNITVYGPTDPGLIGGYGKNQMVCRAPGNELSQLTANAVKRFIEENAAMI